MVLIGLRPAVSTEQNITQAGRILRSPRIKLSGDGHDLSTQRDWWATLIVGVACVACFGIGFMLLIFAARQKDYLAVLPPFILVEGVGVLYLWLMLSTSYELTATEIIVRLGPYRRGSPRRRLPRLYLQRDFFHPA